MRESNESPALDPNSPYPYSLFHSSVIPPGQDRPDQNASVLNILHDAATEKTGMQCIAKAIWNPQGAHMLCSLGDVFCVTVGKAARAYGQGVVETMQIDETVYLGGDFGQVTALASPDMPDNRPLLTEQHCRVFFVPGQRGSHQRRCATERGAPCRAGHDQGGCRMSGRIRWVLSCPKP